MLGLVNRAIQSFLRDTYGPGLWAAVARRARLGFDGFESMMTYDPALTEAVIAAAAVELSRPRETVLEDLGTYLVSHPNVEALRRLLRFGGADFGDFLRSLEDLPDRARLALPDLDMPEMRLHELGAGRFELTCQGVIDGVGHVAVGLLRAMADDYGALVLLDHHGARGAADVITVELLDGAYAKGRHFDLALRSA